jgi:hypothetical protein
MGGSGVGAGDTAPPRAGRAAGPAGAGAGDLSGGATGGRVVAQAQRASRMTVKADLDGIVERKRGPIITDLLRVGLKKRESERI